MAIIKLHENPFIGYVVDPSGQRDRQTGMMKLIVSLRHSCKHLKRVPRIWNGLN